MYLTSSNLKAIRKTDDFHYQIYFKKNKTKQKNDMTFIFCKYIIL